MYKRSKERRITLNILYFISPTTSSLLTSYKRLTGIEQFVVLCSHLLVQAHDKLVAYRGILAFSLHFYILEPAQKFQNFTFQIFKICLD